MTNEELAAIEQRAAAATKGPWYVSGGDVMSEHRDEIPYGSVVCETGFTGMVAATENTYSSDADFIAAARADVPALLAEVRRLRAEVERRTREHAALIETAQGALATERSFRRAIARAAVDAADKTMEHERRGMWLDAVIEDALRRPAQP